MALRKIELCKPRDFGDPKFEMPLVRIRMFPLGIGILRRLAGVLHTFDFRYETPIPEKVFKEILRQECTEYTGHAYFEHQESLQRTGTG